MDSILTSIKKLLGINEDDESFDGDIVMYINTFLSVLTQVGAGPVQGFSISDKTAIWKDFIPVGPKLEMIKTYVYIKVRLTFDPPVSSTAVQALEKRAGELEFYISITPDSGPTVNATISNRR